MNNVNRLGEQEQTSKMRPLIALLVALSPLVGVAAILWRLIAMDRGRFAWSEGAVAIIAVSAVVVGFVGGLYLANRRSTWWILITLLSACIGYLELQVVVASAWSHMH